MNSGGHAAGARAEQVGAKLVYAGLFLLAAELIGALVVRRVKGLYANVTHGPGMPFTTYEQDVLSRSPDVFKASLFFLRDTLEGISSSQAMDILAVRSRRNELAHELSAEIDRLDMEADERLLSRARGALFSLSNRWVRMELGADPDFIRLDPDWDSVHAEDLVLLDRVLEKTAELRLASN